MQYILEIRYNCIKEYLMTLRNFFHQNQQEGDAMGYKGRDVEVIPVVAGKCIVIACDSCGGIGSKEYDAVKVPPSVVGSLTTKVALMEVLATGAEPRAVTAAICNEPTPTAEAILEGVRKELEDLKAYNLPLAISTEKNIPTAQTALGITVIGTCDIEHLRIQKTRSGDTVYCLGVPQVGDELVRGNYRQVARLKHIQALSGYVEVHDILPIGSRGIRKEAEHLAGSMGYSFVPESSCQVDLDKSAGPSTCLIFTCRNGIALPDMDEITISKVGTIV
jgi:hypothetical protein